jgi:hypothetical protein
MAVLSSAAMAVTLQPLQGKVLINRGAGFQQVTKPTTAAVGDSIMVSADGNAQVVYDSQCSVPVKPGNVVTIAFEAPCPKTAAAPIDPDGTRMSLGAKCGDKSFCEPPPADRHWLALVPITAIVVTAGACIGDVICDNSASKH